MKIISIDHIVLTVKDINITIQFYENIMNMGKEEFGDGRVALKFGNQKINLHEYKNEFEPKATIPLAGSENLCFITETKLEEAISHVKSKGIDILEGPIKRTGAVGPILSFYFRDPDGNLIEISNYE
ncbi:MAG: VOC family protein [Arcobacteraceae bacterium]